MARLKIDHQYTITMKCPNCNVTLVMADRQGVEIDYCPQCRGVWLDRGELDKIIERSVTGSDTSAPPRGQDKYHRDKYDDQTYYRKKKRESFLGDLFDF